MKLDVISKGLQYSIQNSLEELLKLIINNRLLGRRRAVFSLASTIFRNIFLVLLTWFLLSDMLILLEIRISMPFSWIVATFFSFIISFSIALLGLAFSFSSSELTQKLFSITYLFSFLVTGLLVVFILQTFLTAFGVAGNFSVLEQLSMYFGITTSNLHTLKILEHIFFVTVLVVLMGKLTTLGESQTQISSRQISITKGVMVFLSCTISLISTIFFAPLFFLLFKAEEYNVILSPNQMETFLKQAGITLPLIVRRDFELEKVFQGYFYAVLSKHVLFFVISDGKKVITVENRLVKIKEFDDFKQFLPLWKRADTRVLEQRIFRILGLKRDSIDIYTEAFHQITLSHKSSEFLVHAFETELGLKPHNVKVRDYFHFLPFNLEKDQGRFKMSASSRRSFPPEEGYCFFTSMNDEFPISKENDLYTFHYRVNFETSWSRGNFQISIQLPKGMKLESVEPAPVYNSDHEAKIIFEDVFPLQIAEVTIRFKVLENEYSSK